jgi:hypothetical protein
MACRFIFRWPKKPQKPLKTNKTASKRLRMSVFFTANEELFTLKLKTRIAFLTKALTFAVLI